jgi:hypothetical protein
MAAAGGGETVLLYIAAHGGIQDKDKPTLRRKGDYTEGPPIYGDVEVFVYSPIGTEYTAGLSSQIVNSGWTNFTLTPSLICDIVRHDDQQLSPSTSESIHGNFLKLQRNVKKLNKVSGIEYRDGGRVERNPSEQRNYYIMPAADERYTRNLDLDLHDKPAHRSNPSRLAVPGDVVSFNYGVFIVDTTYTDPGVDLFSIKKNVSNFECIGEKNQRKGVTDELLKTLRTQEILNCIVDPFDDFATPEARHTFKSCDLFKAGNSGMLMPLIKRCTDTNLAKPAETALANLRRTADKEITLEGIICILRAIIPGLTCVEILDHSCRGLDTMTLPSGRIKVPRYIPDTPPIIHDNDNDGMSDTSSSAGSSRPGTPTTPGGSSRKRTKKRQHKRRKTQTRKHKKKTRRRNNRRK